MRTTINNMNIAIKKQLQTKVDEIKKRLAEYDPNADGDFIERAFKIAEKAYSNKQTPDGRLLIDHHLDTALTLTEYNLDKETLAAAVLHDTLSFGVSPETLEKKFNSTVGQITELLDQLGAMYFSINELQERQHLRQMFVAMAGNVHVVMIELAARLNYLRNQDNMPDEARENYAHETLDIFTPLAHRLGVSKLKSELEDYCCKALYPAEYTRLSRLAGKTESKRREAIERVIEILHKFFKENNLQVHITGRTKHLYSTYLKMLRQGKAFNELFDLAAVRIITNTEEECYRTLSVLHSIWTPVHEEFDDYIAAPKPNGYRSIHTVVIASNKQPVEVQIRTWEMHMTSEFGVAAHWHYKETFGSTKQQTDDELITWLKDLSDSEDRRALTDPVSRLQNVVLDTVKGKVFVLTPRGKIIRLPQGSTPIDFAYRVHTEVGHRCKGAKVNGQIVPIDYTLHNGDVVEIITQKTNAPTRDWLRIAVSSQARSKIRSWFKKVDRDENIQQGRSMLQRELHRSGLKRKDLLDRIGLDDIIESYNYKTEKDLFAAVGCGDITIEGVTERIRRAYRELLQKEEVQIDAPEVVQEPKTRRRGPGKKKKQHVIVDGMSDVMVNFAKCCLPVPHDEVVGFVTKTRGLSLHRKVCPNIKKFSESGERLVAVYWCDTEGNLYLADIQVNCIDRSGLLNELVAILSEAKVNLVNLKNLMLPNATRLVTMRLEIQDTSNLDFIINRIDRIKDVLSVRRKL